jgi:glutaredoxin-like protein
MAILDASLQKRIHDVFAALPHPVNVIVFTRTPDAGDSSCRTCDETRELVEELAAISDGRIRAEIHDLEADAAVARAHGIDKAPAIVVVRDGAERRLSGVRFFGSPAGYEFATLIEDIRLASLGTPDLSANTVDALSHLTTPLHIQVFVTPTCPYCPRAALLAHKMALASEWVTADAVDATEFPDLADRYEVRGVPRTVVNETVHVEGAVPEAMLMAQLMPLFAARLPLPGSA